MSQLTLYGLAAAALFALGLYGLLAYAHLLRKILAVNVMGNAVFLFLVALGRTDPQQTNPVPHAMVLTGIVITVSATAFALALARRLHREVGAVDLDAQSRRGEALDSTQTEESGKS